MKMGNEHIFEDLVYPNYVPAPNGGAEDAISGSTRSPLGAVTCLHYIYILACPSYLLMRGGKVRSTDLNALYLLFFNCMMPGHLSNCCFIIIYML